MLLAMKIWLRCWLNVSGRLWCACWRGAKGTSCSHLSLMALYGPFFFFCMAGDDFFTQAFLRSRNLDEFAHVSNLSLKNSQLTLFFLTVNHPGPSETPLALPAALGGRNSQWLRWGHPSIPSTTFLGKFWTSDLDPKTNIHISFTKTNKSNDSQIQKAKSVQPQNLPKTLLP